ncbi:MAG: hypothetical protein ABR961_16665 [Thermoanaerobaculaceae bacterium]
MAKGHIELENGVYYLRWEGGRDALPADLLETQPTLKELAGKDVEVLLSEPRPFVVAVKMPKRPPILCYLPAPPWLSLVSQEQFAEAVRLLPHPLCYIPPIWMTRGVDDRVRQNIADQLLKEKVINQNVHDAIVGP